MASCERKRFSKKKICVGDLRHVIVIQSRSLSDAKIGDNEPEEIFATVLKTRAGIRTLEGMFSGAAVFQGLNIEDRPTHTFTVVRGKITEAVETGNNFIFYDQRRFRIVRRTLSNEDPYYVDIQCQERGSFRKSASEA